MLHLEILIPDSYVSNVSERLNLYKELNNLKSEEEITSFKIRLKDRFGDIPPAINNICDALRLRWLAKKIGFERILLKNNQMRAYFTDHDNEEYYTSEAFKLVLEYLKKNFNNCEMNEKKQKLSLVVINIYNIEDALKICQSILKISFNQQ